LNLTAMSLLPSVLERDMTFDELRAEYGIETIGERILSVVRAVVESETSDKVPSGFESVDDLLQGFVTDMLLEQGQLAYAFTSATEFGHFRALMFKQLRRYIAARRRRTVVDNLLDRSRRVTEQSHFDRVSIPAGWAYTIAGRKPTPDEAAEAKLHQLAVGVTPSYDVSAEQRDRAPALLSEEALADLLLRLASDLSCVVTNTMLRRFFEIAFTPFIPSFLSFDVEVHSGKQSAEGPATELAITRTTDDILTLLDERERTILRLKLEEFPDTQVARAVGVSRPTLATQKHLVFAKLRPLLEDLDEAAQLLVLDQLLHRLRSEHAS
jgi:hypothetical protein